MEKKKVEKRDSLDDPDVFFARQSTVTRRTNVTTPRAGKGVVSRSSMASELSLRHVMQTRESILPHNEVDIASPEGVEKILESGGLLSTRSRKRQFAVKKLKRRVSMKHDGELISQISMDILMDNASDTEAHKKQVS